MVPLNESISRDAPLNSVIDRYAPEFTNQNSDCEECIANESVAANSII